MTPTATRISPKRSLRVGWSRTRCSWRTGPTSPASTTMWPSWRWVGSRRATGRCSPVTKVRRPSTDPVGTGSSAGCGRRSHCTRRTSNGNCPGSRTAASCVPPILGRVGGSRWPTTVDRRPTRPGASTAWTAPCPCSRHGCTVGPGWPRPGPSTATAGGYPASGQRRSRWARPGRRGHWRMVPETVRGRRGCRRRGRQPCASPSSGVTATCTTNSSWEATAATPS